MTNLVQYDTSEDYAVLYHLAKKCEVICILNPYKNEQQEVALTSYDEYYSRVSISSRGICYLYAENDKHFDTVCGDLNVRWILPYERPKIMTDERMQQVDALMQTVPVAWQYRWCGGEGGPCACMGCVNINLGSKITKQEHQEWVRNNPRPLSARSVSYYGQ